MGDRACWSSNKDDDMFRSCIVSTPIEDCESFRCAVKKSLSSYTVLSGELAEDEAEFEPFWFAETERDRCMALGLEESDSCV